MNELALQLINEPIGKLAKRILFMDMDYLYKKHVEIQALEGNNNYLLKVGNRELKLHVCKFECTCERTNEGYNAIINLDTYEVFDVIRKHEHWCNDKLKSPDMYYEF